MPNDRRSISLWIDLFASIVGLLIALLVGYDLFFDTVPTLDARYYDPSNPFEFPFILRNPSHIFAMYNVGTHCQEDLSVGGHLVLKNFTIESLSHKFNRTQWDRQFRLQIERRQSLWNRCRFRSRHVLRHEVVRLYFLAPTLS